jgi:hypothetical protein
MPQTLFLTCLAWTFRRHTDDLAEILRGDLRYVIEADSL